MNLDFEIKDKALKDALERAPKVLTAELNKGLDLAAQKLVVAEQKQIEENKSFGTSDLIRSVNFKSKVSVFERLVYVGVKHGFYVENGSKGGGMPPKEALITWLRLKDRIDEATAKRQWYPLAKSIKANGTKAKPFVEPALKQEESGLLKVIDDSIMRGISMSFGVN